MSGVRRPSMERKSKDKNKDLSESMNTTRVSLRPGSSKLAVSSQKNIAEAAQELQNLVNSDLAKIPLEKLEKELSEAMRAFSENTRGVLVSQKLSGYRDCTVLLTRYNIHLKKQGKTIEESNSALILSIYKSISEELNKITKEERHEQLVVESNFVPALMGFFEAFATDTESIALNSKDKKGSLMRKNSLKKSIETTATSTLSSLRPTSRGKLSSLSKRTGVEKLPSKIEIVSNTETMSQNKNSSNENENTELSTIEHIVYNCCCVLKNLSAFKNSRKELLKEEYLRTINRYLLVWDQKTLSQFGTLVLLQLTAASRYIANEDKAEKLFLKSNCLETWTKVIEIFPTSNDLVFNMIRILSKLSASHQICQKLNEKKHFLKTLSTFFKAYKSQIHIIIRISYIFANMTSYFSDIRTQLYFDFSAWEDIYTCFEHYATSELQGKSEVDKMGISMAAWDYSAMKKESDVEALMKIIRLIANLFTVTEIGTDIYQNHSSCYKALLKTLKNLLKQKSSLEKYNELIATTLSCLTNILYYDRELLLSTSSETQTKKELIEILVDFVVQLENEEICCESLRVLANLTRMKVFVKSVIEAKLDEAVVILLDSTSKEIVYYCLGIIVNLLVDDDFKNKMGPTLVKSIIEILRECQSDDFDIVTVALKALFSIIDNKTENIEPEQLVQIEECLVALGSTCDKTLLSGQDSSLQSAQECRNLINGLLNSMPEDKFICPVKNCGRKFPEETKLKEHIARRHKV